MGREWYFNWGTKSSSKKKGAAAATAGSGKGGERKTAAMPVAATIAAAATTGGCINTMFHMFDFHSFICLHPNDDIPPAPTTTITTTVVADILSHKPTSLNGVEAPRNSLESSEEMVTGPASLASMTEDERDDPSSNIPVGIEINTRRDTKLKLVQAPRPKPEDYLSSENSISPASARTPNVVARLMGLDVFPESNTTTPRSSSSFLRSPRVSLSSTSTPPSRTKSTNAANKNRNKSSYSKNDVPGPPETPRPGRRRGSNVIDPHRLSLQVNKENSIVKEMESSRPSCSAISTKRREGRGYEEERECRSPGYYARQIMRQVRETVSRRVGVDITNTIGNRDRDNRDKEHRRDEHLLSLNKPKKLSSNKKKDCSNTSNNKVGLKHSETQSVSEYAVTKPEPAENLVPAMTKLLVSKPPMLENIEEEEEKKKSEQNSTTCGNKPSTKKPPLRSFDLIRNKKDEQFVRPPASKKCKKTPPLSNDSVPSLVPLNKDSASPIKLLGKQVKAQPLKGSTNISTNTNTNTNANTSQLSRKPSQRYYERTPEIGDQRSKDSASFRAEFQYISRILKCTGIDRDTPVSFMRWYSTTNPLDPSMYHKLEAFHYDLFTARDIDDQQLGFGFNRKLIFNLVGEILSDLLKPNMVKNKPWLVGPLSRDKYYHQQQQMNGFQLVKLLCMRIRSFPSANCQTLQDIDALVEKDLPRFGAHSDLIAFEEEGEGIVSEIERDIVDSIVQEIALLCLDNGRNSIKRHLTSIRV